ncbi:MAG TPA: hypothetical protein VFF61_04520 [Microvirga sp.]|nr:hypothetical protein [Microvirga sp.]
MLRNIAPSGGAEIPHGGRFARAAAENVIKSARSAAARMKDAVAHARGGRQLAPSDARMLQDIGLEPFDVYFGWRGSDR